MLQSESRTRIMNTPESHLLTTISTITHDISAISQTCDIRRRRLHARSVLHPWYTIEMGHDFREAVIWGWQTRFGRTYCLPWVCCRPSYTGGRSSKLSLQFLFLNNCPFLVTDRNDFLWRLVKGCIRLGLVPDISIVSTWYVFDVQPRNDISSQCCPYCTLPGWICCPHSTTYSPHSRRAMALTGKSAVTTSLQQSVSQSGSKKVSMQKVWFEDRSRQSS